MPVESWKDKGGYQRWTVDMMKQYLQFCGYDRLEDILSNMRYIYTQEVKGPAGEYLIKDKSTLKSARGAFITIFQLGARVSEVLGQEVTIKDKLRKVTKEMVENPELDIDKIPGLYKKDLEWDENSLVSTITLLKKYHKSGDKDKYVATDESKMRWDSKEKAEKSGRPFKRYDGWTTERDIEIRRVSIPRSEPFTDAIIEFVKSRNEKLFPKLKYNKFYRILKKAGELEGLDFPPHRLRAERATQMVLEYDMSLSKLVNWFQWKNLKEALNYTSLAPKVSEQMFEKAKKKYEN